MKLAETPSWTAHRTKLNDTRRDDSLRTRRPFSGYTPLRGFESLPLRQEDTTKARFQRRRRALLSVSAVGMPYLGDIVAQSSVASKVSQLSRFPESNPFLNHRILC